MNQQATHSHVDLAQASAYHTHVPINFKPMLSVQELTFERYFEPVFRPVNFSLSEGKALWVTGANGSGKTTLLRLLSGILSPSHGQVHCTARNRVYLGHQLAVKDDLTVSENIDFMRRFCGANKNRTADLISRVGLGRVATQAARTLSAGQRKRCALARLFAQDAELWLLDEPYANLDSQGQLMLDAMLRQHIEGGGSCVLATHGRQPPGGLPAEACELVSGAGAS
jgi:heme exporter protein A